VNNFLAKQKLTNLTQANLEQTRTEQKWKNIFYFYFNICARFRYYWQLLPKHSNRRLILVYKPFLRKKNHHGHLPKSFFYRGIVFKIKHDQEHIYVDAKII
jgi:hypothetical protein